MSGDLIAGLVFVAAVGAVWVGWGYLSAFLSGWLEMGLRFRDRSPTMPREKTWAQIRLGGLGMAHRAGVMIGVDERGLHLRKYLFGRAGHPPLLFPWDTVDMRGSLKSWLWSWDTYGVGYYTTIGIPTNSKGARLIRGYFQSRRCEVRDF